jgi:hypothetical protein
MAGSVQFRDSVAVLAAYLNRNCPAWSLFQGRQFMFKYEGGTVQEGEAALVEVLDMLSSGTNAIYTLKVYEDLPKGGKIKENTPCDGSFNFRLNEENQVPTQSQITRYNNNNEVLTRLTAIEARLNEDAGEEEEEENETEKALGKIGSLLSNPTVALLANLIFGAKLPGLPAPAAGTVGNIPPAGNTDEEIKKALDVLKANDTRLADHLTKLAAMSIHQPQNFHFLLKTLDSL